MIKLKLLLSVLLIYVSLSATLYDPTDWNMIEFPGDSIKITYTQQTQQDRNILVFKSEIGLNQLQFVFGNLETPASLFDSSEIISKDKIKEIVIRLKETPPAEFIMTFTCSACTEPIYFMFGHEDSFVRKLDIGTNVGMMYTSSKTMHYAIEKKDKDGSYFVFTFTPNHLRVKIVGKSSVGADSERTCYDDLLVSIFLFIYYRLAMEKYFANQILIFK